MGHIHIYCDSCGSSWDVYSRDDWKDEKYRQCPVCGKGISRQTWKNFILRSFGEMEDTTKELMKDHTGYHAPLFTVSYIPDVIFPNREPVGMNEIREAIADLRSEADMAQMIINKLFEGRTENDQ